MEFDAFVPRFHELVGHLDKVGLVNQLVSNAVEQWLKHWIRQVRNCYVVAYHQFQNIGKVAAINQQHLNDIFMV